MMMAKMEGLRVRVYRGTSGKKKMGKGYTLMLSYFVIEKFHAKYIKMPFHLGGCLEYLYQVPSDSHLS